MMRLLAVALALTISGMASPRPPAEPPGSLLQDTAVVRAPRDLRVILGSTGQVMPIDGRGAWRLLDAWGRVHARGGDGAPWQVERDARRLRVRDPRSGRATAWSDEPFTLVPDSGGLAWWEGKRYRGELRFLAVDTAVLVANILRIEDYLRGVVPLEIGPRRPEEVAAIEAQAIAARSYAVVRALEGTTRPWDLTARPNDQAYGGVDAETALSDAAVRATSGLVLTWQGRVVRAPYHSTCGGHTAEPGEVFRGAVDTWVSGVPDLVPGTNRAWCEISPRFSWERRWSRAELTRLVQRQAGASAPGEVSRVESSGTTRSGRVRGLTFSSARGTVTVTGNDLRFLLTTIGAGILPSTYFSATWSPTTGLVLRGRGNGHGVGMCQWGAIARARSGVHAAEILRAYYPGTSVARLKQDDRR